MCGTSVDSSTPDSRKGYLCWSAWLSTWGICSAWEWSCFKGIQLKAGNLESFALLLETLCVSVSPISEIRILWRGIFREPLSLSTKLETVFKRHLQGRRRLENRSPSHWIALPHRLDCKGAEKRTGKELRGLGLRTALDSFTQTSKCIFVQSIN